MKEDSVLTQLKITQAKVSVWELLASSNEHRLALTKALEKLETPVDVSPESLVATLTQSAKTQGIRFSDDDLPEQGGKHNDPLFITVKAMKKAILMVLIDNGSALNVCPLRVASCLGIEMRDLVPSDQIVKAYDNTRREVLGTTTLDVDFGPITVPTSFQVIDVPTSFNLLLGRPWIHHHKAIPSSLHQKVKFPHDGKIITIKGDDSATYKQVKGQPLYEVQPEQVGFEFSGFEFETVQCIEDATRKTRIVPYDFGSFQIDRLTLMLSNMCYLPGTNMSKSGKSDWMMQAWDVPTNPGRFGLGYKPTNDEIAAAKKGRRMSKRSEPSIYVPLEALFCKKGEKPKGQSDIEVFMSTLWIDQEVIDLEMEELMQPKLFEEMDMIMDANEEGDYFNLIKPAEGRLDNWSQEEEGFAAAVDHPYPSPSIALGSSFISESHDQALDSSFNDVVSEFSFNNKFNLSGYIDSLTFQALLDIKEELNEIKNEKENKKIIIGKDNQFTCIAHDCPISDQIAKIILKYEDCLMKKPTDVTGIDPSIVVHRIPLLPGAIPVKQKLRRMKPEWSLKIKDEVAKQLEANFIEPITYPGWLANIVPVPKKDGKVRMCNTPIYPIRII